MHRGHAFGPSVPHFSAATHRAFPPAFTRHAAHRCWPTWPASRSSCC